MNYYDGKIEHGVIYDWKKIKKEFNKLNTPKNVYYPCFSAIESGHKIIQSLSIRGTGKTTQWLLVGLCAAKIYPGLTIQYVRDTEDELTASYASKLVEVIRSYKDGDYIKKLTDGKYNDLIYHWRQFFYAKNENGKIVERSEVPVIQFLDVQNEENYKSSYNTYNSMGDFILYDEFIGKHYRPNTFFHFFNLVKTVFRSRKGGVIVMCANTTNLFSPWFEDFQISKEVRYLKPGKSKSITSKAGTKLYIEYVANTADETDKRNRDESNRLFFGFNPEKLSSITGACDWSFEHYPHMPEETESCKILISNLYIQFTTELYRIRVCEDDQHGLHARVAKATRTYDDSIILSLDLDLVTSDRRYIYGFGKGKLYRVFKQILDEKMIFFSTNEVGTGFYEYLKMYKMKR